MAARGTPEEVEAAMVDGGTAHAALSTIEKLIAASSTEFYVGDTMSVADVLVFAFIGWVASGCAPFRPRHDTVGSLCAALNRSHPKSHHEVYCAAL